VITIQSVMLVTLGFCLAAMLATFLAPFYRRRAERLAQRKLRESVPLTSAEIAADKDRLRAEFAIKIHKLESRIDEASLSAARQMVEINRRDAAISQLEGTVAVQRTELEEHENARRVLEQTITERLPKVEARLSEAKKLLFQRDREISELTQSAQKQALALEEATQINTQQRDELHRVNATLNTRAARNRGTRGDERFDGEIALRAEIEALRTKARDQAQVISRLQGATALAPMTGLLNGQASAADIQAQNDSEIVKLRESLAEAERALQSASGTGEAGAEQSRFETEVRNLKAANQDQHAEIARLRAALKAYEASSVDEKAIAESKITLKARLSALEAKTAEQAATIQSLRAETAAVNEKLARQASYYMDEMRRLGGGTRPAAGAPRAAVVSEPQRMTLSERINAPRVTPVTSGNGASDGAPGGMPEILKPSSAPAATPNTMNMEALAQSAGGTPVPAEHTNGATSEDAAEVANGTAKPRRRPGLLQRITGLEKPVA
jgi:uncharacterized coiled-coil protein SlyX